MLFLLLASLSVSAPARPKIARYSKIQLPKNYNNGFGCDMCTKVVEYIENLLKDQTVESEIVKLVEQLCATFPSPYSSLCDNLVEQFVPIICQWIEEGLEALDICKTIGLCSVQLRKAVRIPQPIVLPNNYNNAFGCDMCTKVVQYIEQLLKDEKVEEEIALLVEQLCGAFPAPYSSICDQLVEQYVPLLIQYLEQGIEALDICTKVGLCTDQKKKVLRVPGKLALPSPRIPQPIVLPNNYNNGFGCDMCKKVVQYIETLLKDQTVESEIVKLVEQLCDTFASPYSSLCDAVVEQFVPIICQWIEEGVEALDICNNIGLCTESVKPVTKKAIARRTPAKLALPSPRIYDNGFGCDMCKKVVDYIEALLKDQTVESEIVKLVEQLCETFPSPYSSLCDAVVEQFVPIICQWIEEGIESADICTNIGLCDEVTGKVKAGKNFFRIPKKAVQPKKIDFSVKSEEGCETCKKWFSWMQSKFAEITLEGVWMLIHDECPKVPYLKYFCEIINEQNIQTFVDLLIAAVPPEEGCSWTHLC